MKYEISENLLNKVLNYLASKPYAEVAYLINELSLEIQQNSECQDNDINNKEE